LTSNTVHSGVLFQQSYVLTGYSQMHIAFLSILHSAVWILNYFSA